MAEARCVTIHLTIGDYTTGHWCPECLLPSAVEFDINGTILTETGVSTFPFGSELYCIEHEGTV